MADLNWSDIVGDKTIENGGAVGDLLALARAHVDDAVTKGKLTKGEAGQIYTAMIPAAFQQGMEFQLREQLLEAQIAEALDSTLRANTQLDDALLTAEKQRLSIDKDNLLKDEQLLKAEEETELVYITKIAKDKETALLGLDDVVKETKGVNREDVYTSKYTRV